MYRIGEFSKMTKTTVKTLRYYDEVGLLSPAYVDPENGYRYYTTAQLAPLAAIVSMRQIGLSVDSVLRVISGDHVTELLNARKLEIEMELRASQQQLSCVNLLLQHLEEGNGMKYQAVVKDLPACTVFYKQGRVPEFRAFQEFILQAGEECRAANPALKCADPDYCYIAYLDPEYRERDIAVEYAQAVTKKGIETDTIHFKEIPSVPAVCVYHKGPYDSLREAYAFAYQWAEQNGYTPSESARECYIDGVWNKNDPAEWLTEIQIPVKK